MRAVDPPDTQERAVVFFGYTAPDTHWMQFHRDLAREIGRRGWKVVWVSPYCVHKNPRWWLASFKDRVTSFARGGWASLRRPPKVLFALARRRVLFVFRGRLERDGTLWDFQPWGMSLLETPGFPPLDSLAVRQLGRALRTLGIERPFLLVCNPRDLPVARRVPHQAVSYWVGDEAMFLLGSNPDLERILAYADLILAVSPTTFDQASRVYPEKTHRLGTGVSLRRVDDAEMSMPPDLADLPLPVVGYVGSISSERFDTELLLASARAIPDATFVLVGPIESRIAAHLEEQRLANLHVLGARPFEDMPRYVSAFDVGVVPYLLNDFNAGADPIKVYEYLAMGKPVVSVAIPAVEELGKVVTIAHSRDGFIDGIRAAFRDRDDAPAESRRAESRRDEVARGHSAEVIADRLIALFEDSR